MTGALAYAAWSTRQNSTGCGSIRRHIAHIFIARCMIITYVHPYDDHMYDQTFTSILVCELEKLIFMIIHSHPNTHTIKLKKTSIERVRRRSDRFTRSGWLARSDHELRFGGVCLIFDL